MGRFTVGEARAKLAEIRPLLEEFVTLRADATELGAALSGADAASPLGGLPEFKATQARMDELLADIMESGAELRGFAPLLVDFPGVLDGQDVQLCWLEGDDELTWYHRPQLGFAGRRRLPKSVA